MITEEISAHRHHEGALLLDIRDLRIEADTPQGWRPIVEGVSLQVRRGEVLGLIGESGAGKSTIGLAALGFARSGCRFSGGSVFFDGIDLLKLTESRRRALRGARIAYVAQSAAASFNPARRLIDQTIECAMLHGHSSRKAAAAEAVTLFRDMQLPDPDTFGNRYPHQVSGGQLQRAMTAMTMICRPDLIVFDEPTTALDVTTQVEVLGSIRRIVRDHNTAALYITHDLAVVAQMADRILVMRDGGMVEEAPTARMLAAPQKDYTRSLWAVRSLEKEDTLPAEPLLTIRNVDASYGDFKVLEDISLDLPKARTVALVGESGSGKSTLARVIAGLMPATGEIRLAGSQLRLSPGGRTRDTLRRVQIIYQSADTALNPCHTVGQLIGRPLSFYFGLDGAERRRRVADLLDMVELAPRHATSLPSELSGGQKQRVAIARAIAADPDLFICDEITSALDQLVQEQILKLILRLQKELWKTYLFITHDIATVNAIADQVVVMQRGRIVQQGARADVLKSADHPYTRELLASVPQLDPGWLDGVLAARGIGTPAS